MSRRPRAATAPPRSRPKVLLGLTIATTLAVSAAGSIGAQASTTNPNPGSLETANAQLSREAAAQGMVLLENHEHTLPLAKGGNISLFGVGAYKTVKGGTGSGNVNNRYTINVRSGLENAGYSVTTSSAYWDAMTSAYDTKYPASNSGAVFGPTVDYASVEQPLTAVSVQPSSPTDTAVFVVARNSGEGSDRKSGPGDYTLTDTEYYDLQLIGQTYKKVVVLLNTGGIVDTSFYNKINSSVVDPKGGLPIDSMLLMSQAGQESGNAVTDVLDGDVTPSGKLTDTWASKYDYYPASKTFGANDANTATESYSEGIYVGYRYFDSFYKKIDPANPAGVVNYPFGFGLSYTDFQIDPQSVTADLKHVVVKAKVTNVGSTSSGKDVVQAYFSAPTGGTDKPYQQLAGYAKTDTLAPGDSQTVTITYNTTDMASYDDATASYVMEHGNYAVRVGDSSRNTHIAAKLALGKDLTTEQVDNELNDATPADELTSNPADFYSYPGESTELAAARTITLDTSSFTTVNSASPTQQNVPVDSSSPYYAIDGAKISSTVASVDADQTDWEGTGAPYQAKTGETVQNVETNPSATLYDVYKGTITLQQFVAGLKLTQLANIVEGASAGGSTLSAAGAAGYTTANYESLGVPQMTLSDGPAGLRLTQQSTTTPKTYQWATAWPIGTLLAQTWDRDLVQKVGAAVGKEMQEYGVSLWLAPGMNIHRDPLNGRNFEYYSEDPLVAGLTAAATTSGVQSIPGEGVTIKHFAANNQEANRNAVDETIDERALREIYLRGFQIAVETSQPMAVMSSYNKINGTYTSATYDLLTDLLRGEWDFKGLVMSDWGGSHNPVASMYAGNDLIMPGNNANEIINNSIKVAPSIDVDGLPVYNKLVTPTRTSYTLSTGGLVLNAAGDQTISSTVDSTTDLTKTPQSGTTTRDALNNQTFVNNAPYNTVAAAYAEVTGLINALSATQKAAITVGNVQYQTPGDNTTPVVAYTVTVKGSYGTAGYTMRLGDLQRSATRVLNIAMHSAQFAQLATVKGVPGIKTAAYDSNLDLVDWMTGTRGPVVKKQTGNGPTVTLSATTKPNASGWYHGPVTVQVSTNDSDANTLIDVDTGVLNNYTGPVKVTGDGVHEIRALAVDESGQFSKLQTLTVKIDTLAPSVSAVANKNATLTLKASDALSGVASIQYAFGSGAWKTYSRTVATPAAPTAVRYRATDKAGNVSATHTVTSVGKLTLSKPKITGKAVVGAKLRATVAKHTAGAHLAYVWKRAGKAIAGAHSATYTLTKASKGKRLTVTVTESKSRYATVSATSAATGKVKA
jgi:beta-glucosidase-like glycosyl hydrolase